MNFRMCIVVAVAVGAIGAAAYNVAVETGSDGEEDINFQTRQAGTVIPVNDDKKSVDVDDDETLLLSSVSTKGIVSDDAKDVDLVQGLIEDPVREGYLKNNRNINNKPPRSSLRTAGVGEEEETGNNIEGFVSKKELEQVEERFTTRLSFLSSDKVGKKKIRSSKSSKQCTSVSATVGPSEKELWDDEEKDQPNPSLGYSCEGIGWCLDANGKPYDFVYFEDITSQAACAANCSSIATDSAFHRGFDYTAYKTCYCLYDDGKAPNPVPGAAGTSTDQLGYGEVAGTYDFDEYVCFSYTPPKCSICDIFSTGANEDGSILGANLPDPHYSLFNQDGLPVLMSVVADRDTISWVSNDATSKWVGPITSRARGETGDYYYKTFFTIPCNVDVSTVSIEGEWAADVSGTILLNGAETSSRPTAPGFDFLQSFHITSAFKNGKNTIEFKMYNGRGPTALRVKNITGTYTQGDDLCPCGVV